MGMMPAVPAANETAAGLAWAALLLAGSQEAA